MDTSVWVRFLAKQHPYLPQLRQLLLADQVVGHELVFGELLMVSTGGRDRLIEEYPRMAQVAPVPHAEVVAFVRKRGLNGRGVGWVDVHLLASAVVAGVRFWTADERLAQLAKEVGIGYTMPKLA